LLIGIVNIIIYKMKTTDLKIAIIGLGYVGLPLAIEFAKKRVVIGFDIKKKRIDELKSGYDKTLEVESSQLIDNENLILINEPSLLQSANCYIITVPTPIDKYQQPDLQPLYNASKLVATMLKVGDIVIYESTVYPGCTEEECVPILEMHSGLKFNKDFFCGYSPERINPGDKDHRVFNIKKITSGSTAKIADVVDDLYKEIIVAGTHKAESIKVAEAAKVIENTQRDLNIALVNELSIIFNKLKINTQDVLRAAGTKWNFLPFQPGLVGGHCIGVDPYYLTYKAKAIGYYPQIILAGRRMNDSMGVYLVSEFIKVMLKKSIKIEDSKILIMGITFKENCPDLRNSGVKKIINELQEYNCSIDLYDPWVSTEEVKKMYGINTVDYPLTNKYDGIIIAVAHNKFKTMGIEIINKFVKSNHVIFDIKHLFKNQESDFQL
jgi:UDP-N-acetyl-D-galactosamine dehydrogenase